MPNIINDIKLDFKDVLLRPKRSTLKSRSEVDLFREMTFRNSKRTYKGIPVMASNMDTHGIFTAMHKYYTAEEWKEFASKNQDCLKHMAVSSGTSDNDFDRLKNVIGAVPDIEFICLDVANGYSQHFVEYVRKVRAEFPSHTIIAGNVVTGEMVEELILSGADVIKVGIGPGSVCTTRMKTGVGYPQLSAVIECADAAHGLKGHIISDGGCTCPGDLAKAFGAGADFVMAGGMFAGHDECGGSVTERNGRKVKLFYGISSEGKTVEVPYRGAVETTVLDILGGLRSACTYVGASKIRELSRRATFIRCTQQLNNMYVITRPLGKNPLLEELFELPFLKSIVNFIIVQRSFVY
ncbi:Similar to Gmpr: GMP reductase 1 (Mus musculus) [Cotesia congregata]|uniref:GMP reductase n=1 Tax=Cotesia congregata TaxID=51543 RepID=A0A8J2HI78_COTCN|nr:Similar to Gmpr: GMP reductase 1 (Mus musculus) [Cotesia congregata]